MCLENTQYCLFKTSDQEFKSKLTSLGQKSKLSLRSFMFGNINQPLILLVFIMSLTGDVMNRKPLMTSTVVRTLCLSGKGHEC